ncbi:surfeit locus protein 6 isoform X1 [Nerophis lumbriciformis]|uniref:surfeit locus protein 6 isoform X1 n=1 Tax=Nerophis lumbriciformis TaxID=546530 RepID=UPI002ADFE789|nr:surfeit locus protein 6 homolog isoform X1 [Nerophis lumbriciformis]
MDLASKDSYIQKLTSKFLNQGVQEPKKKTFVHFNAKKNVGPAQKKKKKSQQSQDGRNNNNNNRNQRKKKKHIPAPQTKSSPAAHNGGQKINKTTQQTSDKGGDVMTNFSTVDILRKRLHEKIEEARGQGAPKDSLSEEVQAKRAKRKMDRERKKRKKKEFRMKKLAEAAVQNQQPEVKQEEEEAPAVSKRQETAIVFNTVETVKKEYVDKALKQKTKKQRLKGQITPLSGKNYKQLLSRVEARKDKLEKLREKDEGKARDMEVKMKWTNMLYKAEGVKIKDDENMLRAALARKEKKRAQRKKQWDQRSEAVVGKMQKRQDKRRRNIRKRNDQKADKKAANARKKGRVLSQDLK